MDFIDELRNFSSRAAKIKDALATEDATKTSLVMPFFKLLGYDIFNPLEFVPEFTADVGIKKAEKVDYAIVIDDNPTILIECKRCGEVLDKHSSQLFRYFGTTTAKFAILTDGIIYKFFTDLSEQNKMDLEPFLVFNVLDIHEHIVPELKRFVRSSLDVDAAYFAAVELKYTNKIREFLNGLRSEPTDSFVKYMMSEIYIGKQTQKAIETFRPI
ncbi:MAG: type I restriction endonuclease [Defluviitaleaceae bacterium]|nr:type I restriction endonuclease [Defluviitaleaceae bacterium]